MCNCVDFKTKHKKCKVSQKNSPETQLQVSVTIFYKACEILALLDKESQFYALKCIFVTIIKKCHTIFECVHIYIYKPAPTVLPYGTSTILHFVTFV